MFVVPPLQLCVDTVIIPTGDGSGGEIYYQYDNRNNGIDGACKLEIAQLNEKDRVFVSFMEWTSSSCSESGSRSISIGGREFCDENAAKTKGGVRIDVTAGETSVSVEVKHANASGGVTSVKLYYVGTCPLYAIIPSYYPGKWLGGVYAGASDNFGQGNMMPPRRRFSTPMLHGIQKFTSFPNLLIITKLR